MSNNKTETIYRSYKLKCYPTFKKSEVARYTIVKFRSFVNEEIQAIEKNKKITSTKGKSGLYNKAQYVARDILSKTKKASKSLNKKWSLPCVNKYFTRAAFEKSNNSKFDYFVNVENLFEMKKLVKVPVKSHRKFNMAKKQRKNFLG